MYAYIYPFIHAIFLLQIKSALGKTFLKDGEDTDHVKQLHVQLILQYENLDYIQYFPSGRKYVSLFEGTEDEKVQALRKEIRKEVMAALERDGKGRTGRGRAGNIDDDDDDDDDEEHDDDTEGYDAGRSTEETLAHKTPSSKNIAQSMKRGRENTKKSYQSDLLGEESITAKAKRLKPIADDDFFLAEISDTSRDEESDGDVNNSSDGDDGNASASDNDDEEEEKNVEESIIERKGTQITRKGTESNAKPQVQTTQVGTQKGAKGITTIRTTARISKGKGGSHQGSRTNKKVATHADRNSDDELFT